MDPDTGLYLELDFYIPSLQLAFEYQVHLFSQQKYNRLCLTLGDIGKTSLHKFKVYLQTRRRHTGA